MTAKLNTTPWKRFSPESLEQGGKEDPRGRMFMNGYGDRLQVLDLTSVVILNTGVDSIRQLYNGTIRPAWSDMITEDTPRILDLLGYPFHVGHMGKKSGYRLRFQNNELGVVILLGSFYKRIEDRGAHLKVELSPHFIAQRSRDVINSYLEALAHNFLQEHSSSGCAVHLAVDFQGYEMPRDLQQRFVTRSRYCALYTGISESDFAASAAVYGDHESYLFGKAGSLQTAIYRKDIEAVVRDKVDYWRETWQAYSFGEFQEDQSVWRVEMRFHHNCVRELGASIGVELEHWYAIHEHLTDLWRYGMERNRLTLEPGLIDPVWQILIQDVRFYLPPTGVTLFRKKKSDVTAVARNIGLMVGNLITLMVRRGADGDMIYMQINRLYCWEDVRRYWLTRGGLGAFRNWIEDAVQRRLLIGKAA